MGKLHFKIFCIVFFCGIVFASQKSTTLDKDLLEKLLDQSKDLDPLPDITSISCKKKYHIDTNLVSARDDCKRYIVMHYDGLIEKEEFVTVSYDETVPVEITMSNILEFQFNSRCKNAYNQPKVPGYTYIGTMQCKYGYYQFYMNAFSFDYNSFKKNEIIGLLLQANL